MTIGPAPISKIRFRSSRRGTSAALSSRTRQRLAWTPAHARSRLRAPGLDPVEEAGDQRADLARRLELRRVAHPLEQLEAGVREALRQRDPRRLVDHAVAHAVDDEGRRGD